MVSRPRRKKLSSEVADGIVEMIRSGNIGPQGQIPTENELVEAFNVSRTSVREAIRSLVALRVLETRPGVGTFVTGAVPGPLRYFSGEPNPIPVLQELLEVRRILEPEIAYLAASRRTLEDLQELERCVVTLENHQTSGDRPPEDLGFHMALAQSTQNSSLMDVSSLIVQFYVHDPFLPDNTDLKFHRAIFEAVRDGDAEGARREMHGHLDMLRERYED